MYSHSTFEETKSEFGEFAQGHKLINYLKILESNLDHYFWNNTHGVY